MLRPAFQKAVDDDCLHKNPFGFELAGVVVNDSVTLNTYTHLGLENAAAEMARMEGVEAARREQQKVSDAGAPENRLTQKMFRVV